MQKFDLIVIGGGPGGYLCAERAGKAGLRPALIEKRALGGTCLNEGCIPTKSLLYCAKQYQAALHGADYGVTAENVSFDHAKVVARKDGVVRTLVRGVGAAMKAHGVTVFSAEGKILGKDGENFTVSAGGEVLSAPRLVIATGSSAAVPPIPGVKEGLASGFVMTNREILALQTQPKSLVCIGGGVIVDGRLLTGAHGVGGELGHIEISAPDKAPCTCGKRGCVEQYASANGIVRVTKKRLAESAEPSCLRAMEHFACKDVFDAARSGDAFAAETLEQVFDYLGEALADACCVCDPERIILGGGVSRAGDYLLRGVERHFRLHMFHACKDTQFALATLGNDAGMYGAFRLLA